MKKTVATVVAVIAIATVVWAQAESGKAKGHAKGGNAAMEQKLIATEKGLWEAWKNKNGEPFRQALSDSTIEVTSGGVTRGRDPVVTEVSKSDCKVRSYTLSDTSVEWLSNHMALLTYKVTRTPPAPAKSFRLPTTPRVSIRKKAASGSPRFIKRRRQPRAHQQRPRSKVEL
jgi:hypothetical protein